MGGQDSASSLTATFYSSFSRAQPASHLWYPESTNFINSVKIVALSTMVSQDQQGALKQGRNLLIQLGLPYFWAGPSKSNDCGCSVALASLSASHWEASSVGPASPLCSLA